MKLFKYNFFVCCALVLSAAVSFSSCDDKNDAVVTDSNIDQLLTANTDLSIFQAALQRTRLDVFSKGGGPFTIFAPTNAAFNAAGIASAADLATIDSNRLIQILTYHIQSANRSFTEIPLGPNATMVTQGGSSQYGARYVGGSAFINGAEVSGMGTRASNGYLYVINKLLLPATTTNAGAMAANPNLRRMLQALTKTVVPITANPLTILAVPNNVMEAAGYDSTTIANLVSGSAGFNSLKAIMQYHLIPQRIFSPNFKAGTLKTVQGTNLVITTSGGLGIKGTNNPAPFRITSGDVLTTTGVIHTIDGLLKN